jgi:2-oxoglutarate dehydrogenase E1 component
VINHTAVREQFLFWVVIQVVFNLLYKAVSTEHERRQIGVLQLIAAYRNRGHQKAKLDPLGLRNVKTFQILIFCTWFNQI